MHKKIIYTLVFGLFILAGTDCKAQEFVGLQISPNFSSRLLNSSDSHLKDSLDAADNIRTSVSYGIDLSFNLNKSLALNTGLRYSDYGFTRIWYDLQFHDEIHPDIGRIEDLSEAAQKDAYFYHKFRYLDIPIRLNYQISKKRHQQDYRIYLHAGVINHIFLSEEQKVFFKGFSVGGERTYTDISTGYNMRSFNISAVGGARFILRIAPDIWISAQPEFNFPLLESNEGGLANFRLIQVAGNFGISKALP